MTASVQPFDLIKAPLRNRLRLELKAPIGDVWALVGNLARMSDYSAGLERVDAITDARGHCTEYTCHFKPMQEGEAGMVSRDLMQWYQPCRGWASSGATGDVFGLSDDLHLVTVEGSQDGTLLTWDAYYQAHDLAMMQGHMQEALSDIGENLRQRFGGRLIHCYTAA